MRFSDTADNHMMLLKTLPFSKPKLYNKVSGKWSQDFAGCVWGTVGFFERGFYTISRRTYRLSEGVLSWIYKREHLRLPDICAMKTL